MDKKSNDNVAKDVALPLSRRNKLLVTIANCLFMFYIAGHGTAIAISQAFILTKINGMEYFSLAVILIALGAAIIIPIGGKLGDIVGRRTLMVSSGILAFITTVGMAYSPNIWIYLGITTVNSLSKGAFTAAPYILMNMINEKKDVPKAMGFLASSVSAGILVGALISGIFNDMNLTELGLIITGLFVLVAVVLIFIALPNTKSETKIKLDLGGIALLTVVISSFVLSFNFAPTAGWTNPIILLGFAVLVVSLVIFIKYEKQIEAKNEDPIIAMSLFKNKEYTVLLIVGLIAYFYQTVLVDYGALASLRILGASATVTGMLTIPRTLIILVLPTLTGVWVGKKKTNLWKAMALATGIVALSFTPLIFISPSMSIAVFFISFSITGIAESLRAVSITPAAQEILTPENLSTGTSLVNFVNTLSSVLASTICGVLFNAAGDDIVKGMSWIFMFTVLFTIVGFLLVIFIIKKIQEDRTKLEAAL